MSSKRNLLTIPLSAYLFFLIIVLGLGGAFFLWFINLEKDVKVFALKQDVPAYYSIQDGDFTQINYDNKNLMEGTITDSNKLQGYYTLRPLSKNVPISSQDLIESSLLRGKVITSLKVPSEVTLGHTLKEGHNVDITLISNNQAVIPVEKLVLFKDILVLSIQPYISESKNSYLVTIAMKEDEFRTFISLYTDSSIFFSQTL